MKQKPANWLLAIVLGFGIFTIATSAVLVRLCNQAAGIESTGFSLAISALRLVMASGLCLPLWRGMRSEKLAGGGWKLAIGAGVALAIHFSFWITSISYTSIAAATTLVTTNPLWVALIVWVWQGKKPSKLTGTGIVVAMVGSVLIALGGDRGSGADSLPWLGNLLALMGAWMASIYLILGQQAQQRGLSLAHYTVIVYTTGAICLLPLPPLLGTSYTGHPVDVYLYIGLMAVLPQAMGHTAMNWAVHWTSPTLVALAVLCEPIGATILAYFAFREMPAPIVFVGAIIVLVGIAIATALPNFIADRRAE
ncbi:DMT family transporter [Roseofilum casamattae]|uniref:DMT family transporter n=1 Tax=Roseofilum casamattae BLCC-M143 TaxID=3022442 RepID=A0ABT7BRC4_9CYAN|nr:DMT family transporter [Roseofilum casamattae]MDJ1181743.1 DMT family transporter [Roseofilum casamattae BLCC-M143]